VVVTISDTGFGVREDVIDKLFEPFYTTKPSGMGMGLSVSRSIVEKPRWPAPRVCQPRTWRHVHIHLACGCWINPVCRRMTPTPGTVVVVDDDLSVREALASLLGRSACE